MKNPVIGARAIKSGEPQGWDLIMRVGDNLDEGTHIELPCNSRLE